MRVTPGCDNDHVFQVAHLRDPTPTREEQVTNALRGRASTLVLKARMLGLRLVFLDHLPQLASLLIGAGLLKRVCCVPN